MRFGVTRTKSTAKKLPTTKAQWEAVVAAAPGKDLVPSVAVKEKLTQAVVVKKGGYAAVKAALVEKRQQGHV